MPSWARLPGPGFPLRLRIGPRRRAGALMLLVTLAAIGLAMPVRAQTFATLTFDGRLTVNGKPAPNQEIVVVAGPELRLLTLCGRTTSDGSGHYTMNIDPRPACTDEGNDGGPVSFIFAWKGQQVGGVSTHYRPQPGQADLIVENLNIFIPRNIFTLTTLPADLRGFSADDELLVPRRYYGTVLVHGQVPQGELSVSVTNGSYPCGRGTVEAGKFVVDIDDDSQCASPRSGNGWKPVVLTFLIDGRQVWRTNIYLRHELPTTLGKAAPTEPLIADWLPR